MVKNKYYKFTNEETKNMIEDYLNKKGYTLPNNKRDTYSSIKEYYRTYDFKNNDLYVESYFNSINKQYEYIYTCAGIFKR